MEWKCRWYPLSYLVLTTYQKCNKVMFNILVTTNLVIEVSSVLPVILVTAVLCRRALPFHVISQVVLKYTGEGHCWQHAHHWSKSQHQAHHDTSEIDSADGIQGHCSEKNEKRTFVSDQDNIIQAWVWFNLKENLQFKKRKKCFNFLLSSHTISALPLCCSVWQRSETLAFIYSELIPYLWSHWQNETENITPHKQNQTTVLIHVWPY